MARKKTSTKDKTDAAGDSPAAPYVVLARKYRPQTFDDLIGQGAMVQTLSNAFQSGRIAQGYMLTGVRGVGKTTTARILARALNYETDDIDVATISMPTLGRHCAEIMESRHPDVLEMDAASNTGVDNVRELIESARYKPLTARNKIYIIDEVHMLSKGAFNALLKTLEEPPEHVRFIFATTEIRKVPVTVLSRCQRFDLRRVDVPTLTTHLTSIAKKEGAKPEPDAVGLIARAAEGSVRDALSILDQAIAMGSGAVSEADVRAMLGLADRGRIFDVLDDLFAGNAGAALKAIDGLYSDGAEPVQITADLAEAVHVAARTKALGAETASEALSAEERRRAQNLADQISVPVLARAWQMLIKGLEDVRRAPNPISAVEMVIIRLSFVADLPSPEDLIKTLEGHAVPSARGAQKREGADHGSLLTSSAEQAPATAEADKSTVTQALAPEDQHDEGRFEGTPGEVLPNIDDHQELNGDETQPGDVHVSSFADVVNLVAQKRDAKLKMHLEDHVSLVRFDGAAGAIDLKLLEGAPPRIANDLRENLIRWTGRQWMVMLSSEDGQEPIGTVKRRRVQEKLDALKAKPAVAAVLEAFPDAKVVETKSDENRDGENGQAVDEKPDDSAVG